MKINKNILILLSLLIFITAISCSKKDGSEERLYLNAVDYYAKQDFSNALNCIDLALKKDSSFYQADFLKCKIFHMQDDYERSIKIAGRLIKKYPEYTDARIWYIRNLIYLNDFEKAQECLVKELSFNVSDWRIFYLYSVLAAKQNKVDEQLVMLNRAEAALYSSQKVYGNLAEIWKTLEVQEKVIDYKLKSSILINKSKSE